jgi:outer membrane receptor protein involved in Fe transport
LWNYEIGAKGRLFGRALEYQVNAFWIDWKDIQVQQVTQTAALHYIGNAGNAVSKGVEFELTARPIEYLRINFAGSLAGRPSEEGRDACPNRQGPDAGTGRRQAARRSEVPVLARPRLHGPSGDGGSDWTYTLASDITHQGKRHAYFEGNPFDITLDSYTLVNVRAGVSNDVWSATLFVRNLTDKRAQVSAINSNQDPHALITVRPRTMGVTLTRDF